MDQSGTISQPPQWIIGPPSSEEEAEIPIPIVPQAKFTEKLRVYVPIQLKKIGSDPLFPLFLTFTAFTIIFSLGLLFVGSAFGSAILAARTVYVASHLLKLTIISLIATGVFTSLSIISCPRFSRKKVFCWAVKKGRIEDVRSMMDVGHLPTEKDIGLAWFYEKKEILLLFEDRNVSFGAYQDEIETYLRTESGEI